MNKSIIVMKHDAYSNLNDFLLGLEAAIVAGKDSYYTVIVSGDIDPFVNPVFYRDGYTTMVKITEVAKNLKTRLSIHINTRMPNTISSKNIRDIFHIYPVGINYYITNHDFERNVQLLPVEEAIKKLETWDSKNPMKTQIVFDIDEHIHNVRRNHVINAMNNTYISVSQEDVANFRKTKSNLDKIKTLLHA